MYDTAQADGIWCEKELIKREDKGEDLYLLEGKYKNEVDRREWVELLDGMLYPWADLCLFLCPFKLSYLGLSFLLSCHGKLCLITATLEQCCYKTQLYVWPILKLVQQTDQI